ncbi:Cyanate permease [Alkalispirochaeta americana]|uniref:Cyanate permease n=1 Tax=Alkalispirochaeta americana TaxID=159291 RepID=A0A1N6VTM7_9SPIO|nr:MFS transporter [Alkalispirochaeta americana]SIQ81150.1 Cyanate permease [Alkalispirochaeta americana]
MSTKILSRGTRPYQGYRIVAASFVVQGTIVGAIFTYGLFLEALQSDLGWSRAVISAGSSLASLMMGICAMIFGGLTDKIGPRRILALASVAISLGFVLMSRVTAPWQLLVVYPICIGLAFGSHDVVTLSTVSRWFERRRGIMSAIVKTGTGVGQVIGPAAVAILITTFGWRTAYLWIAAVTGPLVFCASRLLHRSPEDSGVPHGDRLLQNQNTHSTLHEPAPIEGIPALMKNPQFRRVCIAQAAVFFCTPVIIVHIVPYAIDMGIERTLAAGILSVIGAISIAGRLVMGTIIDRLGGKRALLYCYAVLATAFVFLQFTSTAPRLYLFALIYGFGHGGLFTCVSPLIAELFGTRSHGQLYGTTVFAGTLAGSLGPTVAGGIFDLLGTYRPAFLLLIFLVAMAAIAVASIQPRRQQE